MQFFGHFAKIILHMSLCYPHMLLLWVLEPALPSLAAFPYPAYLGSWKQIKSQVLAGFYGFVAKATKPIQLGSLELGTQPTQITCALEPSIPILAGFIKTLKSQGIVINFRRA